MRYQGRHVDPIALWSEFVELPTKLDVDEDTEFLPLVVCPNPDHATSKRHFQINVRKPLVHCFAGCGISGTYEHAISMITGETQRASRKRIFRHSRIGKVAVKKRSSGPAKNISPADLLYDRYIPAFGIEYLEGRGITPASIARWELGWDREERRIVIPVKDARGRVRMLVRRAVREKDWPKYLYTDGVDKTRLLFGAGQIDLGMVQSSGLVLVEGTFDTMINHQNGFPNTEGILGSKLDKFQARMIANMRPPRIITMFDADGSGIVATQSVIELLPMIPVFVGRYPKGKSDPGMLNPKEAARVIDRAITSSEFRQRVRHLTRSKPSRERNYSFG